MALRTKATWDRAAAALPSAQEPAESMNGTLNTELRGLDQHAAADGGPLALRRLYRAACPAIVRRERIATWE
jgi:hypothetical protein